MKILTRGDITLIESNLIESSTRFNLGEAYTKGDKVNDSKCIYQALSDNVDKPLDDKSVWEARMNGRVLIIISTPKVKQKSAFASLLVVLAQRLYT